MSKSSMNISNKLPDLIGIGGTFASGKDSLAHELADRYGYTHVSTGDIVRTEAMKRYGNIERSSALRNTAIEMRQKFGSGILVETSLDNPRPLVLTGIRTAGEVKALKSAGGTMVFVDANPELRYERMKSRLRDGEALKTFDEFIAYENQEISGAKTDSDQNIGAVREMSDVYLENNGTLDKFIATAIGKLEKDR